jgi:WD40 repeat protein
MKRVFGFLALLSFLATLWLGWESKRPVPRATVLRQVNRGDTFFFTGDARLFVCGDVKQVRVYDVLRGELLATWPRSIRDMMPTSQLHGDWTLVGFRTKDELEIFDLISGKTVGRLTPGQATRLHVYFAPDGKLAATVHDFQTVRVWEVETGRLLREFEFGPYVLTANFSPDSARLAVGGRSDSVRVIVLSTGEVTTCSLPVSARDCYGYFCSDGRLLAYARISETEELLWDLSNNCFIASWRLGACRFLGEGSYCCIVHSPLASLAIPPYRGILQAIAREFLLFTAECRIYDTRTGRLVASFPCKTVDAFEVFPDGRTLATFSSRDGCLRLWDLPPKRAVHPGFAWSAFGLTIVLTAWWWSLPRRGQPRRTDGERPAGAQARDEKATG